MNKALKLKKEQQRKKLEDKAIENALPEDFDPIDFLTSKEADKFMKLEFELGLSDFNPDKACVE